MSIFLPKCWPSLELAGMGEQDVAISVSSPFWILCGMVGRILLEILMSLFGV
jgi:hypothetical protein